ncbi:pentatricopeptide repeat-containing protein 1, mitochondrial [Tachysurus fulvidraco]|uniref:pentatricopeptide repeat-containing protein 1, mitochondrial n=1 Tax=Tachysurus fulvidraco TaxID=1234273 RepID=UPI001FEE67A1|nr:pentatricopeptide repeat-containing protein 1, mitochondrial [Tachysurus fulvidraco]XP_047658767.1 pentatricopeptide repeat-containing protein 1, mitochondrial [Tachysurus fulvidraco]XP_047658768.1 pentatricopeptide repeat-containing protein 1, mitochondrial [Tachysurus fulvidraco]
MMMLSRVLSFARPGGSVSIRNTQPFICNSTSLCQISWRKFANVPNPTGELDEVQFGDHSGSFSSRMSYRKSSAELHDSKHTDAEVEQDEPDPNFRPRTKHLKRNTPYWYLLQCKKLLKKHKLSEALALFETEMLKGERLQPEEYNYTVLIGGCGRAGYIKKAFKLYNDMKKRGLEPSDASYTALFNACAESPWKQSALEQALKLRQELNRKNIPLNAITHHALLKTLARAGDLKACFQVLREMLQSRQAITQETFQYLLMCCVEDKVQGFRLALQVWHQMLSAGIKPDAQNYNILLRAARDCGIGDPALASKLLLRGREETQLTAQGKGQRSRLRERTRCEPELLDVDALERRVLSDAPSDLTQSTLHSDSTQTQPIPVSSSSRLTLAIKSTSPSVPNLLDPSTCHSDVVALATASTASDRLALIGDLDGFLNKMFSDGLKPSIKTLTLLADVTEPNSQSVRSLMDVAKQSGVRLDVGFFNTLIRRAARAGDVQGAEAVKALMLERKLHVNAQTFCSLALACRTQRDGFQLLSDMQACSVRANAHVFSALIGQATRRLDYAWLHELLHQMHQLQVAPNDVIINQLEFASRYPPTYDQYKSKKTYLEKINGFRGFYKQWLEFTPAQETPPPWDKHHEPETEIQQDGVESRRGSDKPSRVS